MAWTRLADSRMHLALILAAYLAAAAAVAVHCVDLLTADGQAYLRMAVYYSRGELRRAVFDVWAPLAAWLTAPVVALGVVPRHAFRLQIVLWGAAATVGAWLVAGRLGLRSAARAAATACAALIAAQASAEHRVDLLVAVPLLFYLAVALDGRLLHSGRRAFGAGVLGGVAYLAKFYALPFFVAHFSLAVLFHGMAGPAGPRWWRGARAWALGMAGCLLPVMGWAAAVSARIGRPTLGVYTARAYTYLGSGAEGQLRREAITGLRRAPRHAYNVWQDADLSATEKTPSRPPPWSSWAAARRQIRHSVRNLSAVVGHVGSQARFHAGIATAVLLLVASVASRRRATALRHRVALAALLVYCGGYVAVYAECIRYFWFVFIVAAVAAFGLLDGLPSVLALVARRSGRRERELVAALVGLVALFAFAEPSVRWLRALLAAPPPGRAHRRVAERLAEWGVAGPLAAVGARGWWDGLHVAYYADAKYTGAPAADDPAGIVQEMRGAGAATLLVFGRPRLAEALRVTAGLEALGTILPWEAPGLVGSVSVFRLRTPRPAT